MKPLSFVAPAILFIVFMIAGLLRAGEMRLAADSVVLSNGTWIRVSELKSGDIVQTIDGESIRITEVQDVNEAEPSACYGMSFKDGNLAPIVGPGFCISKPVEDRRCNWFCWLRARLGSLIK